MAAPALLAAALQTRRDHDIGLLRQARQIARLRWSGNRLDAWEYYFFRVFLPRYPMSIKRCFIGWRREVELDRLLNSGAARTVANDKLKFYAQMRRAGIPVPRIAAIYRSTDHGVADATTLRDRVSLIRYLTESNDYPLFVKPVRGAHGLGTFAIRGIRGNHKTLELTSGQQVPLSRFAADLEAGTRHGYLLQELMKSPASIRQVCGNRLTSLRMVVYMQHGTPEILSAVWRVPTGANVTDNFSNGFSGNLIGGVSLERGTIDHVFQGMGWECRAIDQHPDTGQTLPGFQLPNWRETKQLCVAAATRFPTLRLQHWDIALSDRGPLALELNVDGGLRTHQIVASGPWNLLTLSGAGE